MKAFNGNKELKEQLVTELKEHKRLDAFIQGDWLTEEEMENGNFKGCFYGCTMQTDDKPLKRFTEKYNIDLWYVYITEKIFEGLSSESSKNFPLNAIEILPIDFDFNKVISKFHYALLMDIEMGVINFCNGNKEVEEVVKQCADLFKVDFNLIDSSAAYSAADAASSAAAAARARSTAYSALSAARSAAASAALSVARSTAYSALSAARSAAASAALSAARSAAASAALSVARSAAYSARSAARSAADSAAASAADSAALSAHYEWMKNLLLTLIKEN
jgi:hypothetical protein